MVSRQAVAVAVIMLAIGAVIGYGVAGTRVATVVNTPTFSTPITTTAVAEETVTVFTVATVLTTATVTQLQPTTVAMTVAVTVTPTLTNTQFSSPSATGVEPVRIYVKIGNTSGYLVVADTEEFQRKGYELVREGDLGVLFVFKDLPKAVCFHNPFNFTIYVYIVRSTAVGLTVIHTTVLRPQGRWCTLLLSGEFILESRLLWKDLLVVIERQ